MITKNLLEGKQKLLKGSKIYVDPSYSPSFFVDLIDILPFFIDKIVIYEPTDNNLDCWNYCKDRFSQFVDEGIFVPIFIDESSTNGKFSNKYICRKELIEESSFWRKYDGAVREDVENEDFINKVATVLGIGRKYPPDFDEKINELALCINWDIIVSQILKSPIFIHDKFKPLLEYKYQAIVSNFNRIYETPKEVENVEIFKKFMHRMTLSLPRDFSIDEIKEFRKERISREFRTWFEQKLNELIVVGKVSRIDLDEELQKEFYELTENYQNKINKTEVTITAAVAGLAGLYAGPAAAIPPIIGPFIFPNLITELWKNFGPNNWVFMLMDIKKNKKK